MDRARPGSGGVPASQAWFWAEDRQRGERRADADIAAGRTTTYRDAGA